MAGEVLDGEASSCGTEVVTGLTDTTLPVSGTPAVQVASPSRATSAAIGRRRRRKGRLPTDGDLRDGRRLRLGLGSAAWPSDGSGLGRSPAG